MIALFLNQFAFVSLYQNSQKDGYGGTIYMPCIFFVLLFLPSMKLADKHGNYRSLMFGVTVQLFGLLLAQAGGVYGILGGLVLNGVAMPFLFSMFMSVSGAWFNAQERIFASGLLLFSIAVGAWGAKWAYFYEFQKLGPSLFFTDAHLGLGISNLVLLIVASIVYNSKPGALPSRSQTVYRRVGYDFSRDIRLLKQDRIFRVAFPGMVMLVIYSYFAPYTSYFHYVKKIKTSSENVVVDVLYPLLLLVGILFSTTLLAFIMTFRKLFIACLWANMICLILIEIGLLDPTNTVFYVGYLGQAFFIGTIQVLIYEFTSEICFPVSQAVATSLLHLIAMPVVLLLTEISYVINYKALQDSSVNAVFDYAMALMISGVSMMMWQASYRLKRIEFDFNDGQARE